MKLVPRALLASAVLLGLGGAAQAACDLKLAAKLPVVMDGNDALIPGEINGRPARALIDSGATLSMIWADSARAFGLRPIQQDGLKIVGVGGVQTAKVVTLQELKLGTLAQKKIKLLVADGAGSRNDVPLLVGQDFLGRFDVEFDLKNSMVRLLDSRGCEEAGLAYWAEGAYEVVDLESRTQSKPLLRVTVLLNGKPVRALLDTGAYTTVVSLAAARRAGLTPGSPGVKEDGVTAGLGSDTRRSWVGTFPSFQIGDEVIKGARIRIADLWGASREAETGSRLAAPDPSEPEMLLGADFFRAHRVLVSTRQNKVYFTYNGGPVFQTEGPLLERAGAPTGS